METVILGRQGVERRRLEDLLIAAGHGVRACHDRDWGCVGLDDDCPLERSRVDVAVIVSEPGGRFDTQGVACVHRARIPLVAVGASNGDPVLRHTTAHVGAVDTALLDTLERARGDASGHIAAVEEALAEHTDQGEPFTVFAERRPDRLSIQLVLNTDRDRSTRLADVARAAARGYDSAVPVIDVSVVPTCR